ncbi:hypothetical protein Tco_0612282, partial [Tanacetum coccineum]
NYGVLGRYGVSVLALHQRPRRKQDPIRRIHEDQYAVFKLYGNKIFWKISNVVPTLRNPKYADSTRLGLRKKYRLSLKNDMPPRDKWGNNESTDDIVSSDDECEEYDYENPPNTTTNSFFKPYSKTHENNNVDKEDKRSQTKRKCCNNDLNNDEQPIKRVCKAEKFEAIKYSLGPNEEYIAIRRCEYTDWERNEDSMSKIYQEIFQKKDNGWKVMRTE